MYPTFNPATAVTVAAMMSDEAHRAAQQRRAVVEAREARHASNRRAIRREATQSQRIRGPMRLLVGAATLMVAATTSFVSVVIWDHHHAPEHGQPSQGGNADAVRTVLPPRLPHPPAHRPPVLPIRNPKPV